MKNDKLDRLDEYIPDDSLSRRDFLKLLGLTSGILISVPLVDAEFLQEGGGRQRGGSRYPEDFNAYLLIAPDGKVTGFTGKIEQGQGPITALPQMIADELDVAYDSVHMVLGDTDLCPWDMGTFGSLTIRMFGPALRAAAAEARAVLVALAAEKLAVPVDRLAIENGVVFDKSDKKKSVTYGALAAGRKIERHITSPKPSPKPVSEWKVMGQPFLHRDASDKVTGKALFAGDVRVPGMLYARVLRPPAHGATLKSVDSAEAEKIPGVKVVRDAELVAALHELPDVAAAAIAKIKAEYDLPASDLDDKNIFDHLLKVAGPPGEPVAQGGDLSAGAAASAVTFDETYLNSYVAHSCMETHTALVKIDGDKATAWASSQAPFRVKEEVAKAAGLPADRVHVISPFVGGGFGGKTFNLQAVQAARLAKSAGRPVQVTWSRGDEFFFDTFRPAAVVKIKSGLDKEGRILFWDYTVYFAGSRSSAQFYDVPNHRTVGVGEWGGGGGGAHPFSVGAWRAPGSNTNTFAREVHIDIMAAKAGLDPLEFRLKNLTKNERMQRVLQAAAEKFGWKPAPSPSGRGVGIACGDYPETTCVATIAEVEVDKGTGAVKVKRIVTAQDMGQVCNPEGAKIQIEGCAVMGLGYALTEEVHFKGGAVLDSNYDTYEIPRITWLPQIEAVLVKNDEAPFSSGGEPPIINIGAVIANAVFDATGARLFQLPMTPARVKLALAKAVPIRGKS